MDGTTRKPQRRSTPSLQFTIGLTLSTFPLKSLDIDMDFLSCSRRCCSSLVRVGCPLPHPPSGSLVMQFFICAACTILMHTANALLVDVFPDMSSTAYASGQIARCGLSAASVAILDPLVGAVGRGWYFTMFAFFIGISAVVSVTASRRKGMKWRQRRVGNGPG